MWWNDCVFERTEEHRRCSGKGTSFSVYVCKKNLFYYKEILHYATLRSEWQSSVSESRIKNPRHQIIVLNAKFFYSHYVLRKQSWRNSFSLKRDGKSAYFLSQSSRRIGEMIVFLRALRNIGDVLETFYNLRFLRNDKVASTPLSQWASWTSFADLQSVLSHRASITISHQWKWWSDEVIRLWDD